MRYMLMMFGDFEAFETPPGSPEFDALMAEYIAFEEALAAEGIAHTSEQLDDPNVAQVLRVRDHQRLMSDGPFPESKEHLGGYYIIDVPSFDDAIRFAAMLPDARTGAVEIRPIIEHTILDAPAGP